MFDCPNCGEKAGRLVIYDGPLGCPSCVRGRSERNVNIHQNAHPRIKMTYAERQRIVTRTKGKDGVWRAAPQWRGEDGI